MSPWVWIVLAIIVIAVIVGLVVSRNRTKQLDSRREEAASIRDGAAEHRVAMRETETAAAASGAEAQRAREQAEAKVAQARELEAKAQRDSQAHEAVRQQHDEQMRRADALDPDVRTDDEGFRLDDDGNRVDQRSGHGVAAGLGAAGVAGAGALAAAAASRGSESSRPSESSERAADATAGEDGGAGGAAGAAGTGDVGYADERRPEGDDGATGHAEEGAGYESGRTDSDLGGETAGRVDGSDGRTDDLDGRTAPLGSGDEPVRDVRTGEVLDDEGYSTERADGDETGATGRTEDGDGGYSTERTEEGVGSESTGRSGDGAGHGVAAGAAGVAGAGALAAAGSRPDESSDHVGEDDRGSRAEGADYGSTDRSENEPVGYETADRPNIEDGDTSVDRVGESDLGSRGATADQGGYPTDSAGQGYGSDSGRTGDDSGYSATPGSGDEPVRDVRTGEVLDDEGYSTERTGDGDGGYSTERTGDDQGFSATSGSGEGGYSSERSENASTDQGSDPSGEPVGYETADRSDSGGGDYSSGRTEGDGRDQSTVADAAGVAGAGALGAAGAHRDESSDRTGNFSSPDRGDEPVGYETGVRTGADDGDRGYTTERTAEGGYGSAERAGRGGSEPAGGTDDTVGDGMTGGTVEEGGNRAGNWSDWESSETERPNGDLEERSTTSDAPTSGAREPVERGDDAAYGTDDREGEGGDERRDDPVAEEPDRRSWVEKARDRVDDALGRDDADEDGRRG